MMTFFKCSPLTWIYLQTFRLGLVVYTVPARSTPMRMAGTNGDRVAEPADAHGANLIGQ